MLFKDIKIYAQGLVDKNYSSEDVQKLVKVFIGSEKVFEDDGTTEVIELKLDLEEKEEEEVIEKQIEIEVKKQAKKENKKIIRDMPRVEYSYGEHNALKGFKDENQAHLAGLWLKGNIMGDHKARDQYRNYGEKGTYTLQDTTDSGGAATAINYVIPTEVAAGIQTLSLQYGVAERNCTKVTMKGDVMYIPKLTTGPAVAWEIESAAVEQTDLNVGRSTLNIEKVAAFCKVSSELMQDSPINVANYFAVQAALSISAAEDKELFLGTGSPITGLDTNITAAVDSGSTAFTLAKAVETIGTLPTYAQAGAKFYMHRTTFYIELASLLAAGGGNTIQTLNGGIGQSFLGYPCEFVEIMDSTPSGGETVGFFGNLGQTAWMGTKPMGLEISVNPYLYWANDIIGVRVIKRVGICTDVSVGSMVKMTI
jgi:HK97 family phage major capsid protein